MRKIIATILILSMALALCGCKKKTTMKVYVQISGYGIAGDDFSGSKEYDIEDIKEGDIIYEYYGDCLSKECRSQTAAEGNWTIKILEISDEGVKIETRGGSRTWAYGTKITIDSLYYVCDMPDYDYTISFEQ